MSFLFTNSSMPRLESSWSQPWCQIGAWVVSVALRQPPGFIRQIVTFSAVANVTYARYGSSKTPAARRTRQKATSVAASTSHHARMSINARPERCRPRNRGVHHALNNHCATNIPSARRLKE